MGKTKMKGIAGSWGSFFHTNTVVVYRNIPQSKGRRGMKVLKALKGGVLKVRGM